MSNREFNCLKADLSLLSTKAQRRIIERCVPEGCIPADWTCEDRNIIKNIQSLIDNSGATFDNLESAECIRDYIEYLISFPGSYEFFGLGATEKFRPMMFVHKCNDCNYQYKKDFFRTLAFTIKRDLLSKESERFGMSLIYGFLNAKEKELPLTVELFYTPERFYDKIHKGMSVIADMLHSDAWKHLVPKDITFENLEAASTAYYGLISEEAEEIVRSEIIEKLEEFSKKVPIATNGFEYQKIYVWVLLIVKLFNKFVKDNPLSVLPRSETVDIMELKKVPIRVLKNYSLEFIVAHELLHILMTEKLDVSGFEKKISAMKEYSSIPFDDISKFIPPEILEKIDFVKVEMMDGCFGPTPIPTYNGSHFVMVTDFIEHILYNVIVTKKVFYGMKKDQKGFMKKFFDDLGALLGNEFNFIDVKHAKLCNEIIETWHKKNFPSPSKLDIRKISRFTLKDLRNELMHLELLEIFPNIMDYTEKVYNHEPFQNGWGFDTCYMHDVVRTCQVISLQYEFPTFTDFLHAKAWCRAIKVQCPRCEGALGEPQTESAVKDESEESEVEESDETLECESEETKLEEASKPSIVPDTTSSEETSKGSESSVSVEAADESVTVQKVKKEKKIRSEPKESESCPKCFRASEYTREANEKLRLEKIETKALKKKVTALETKKEEWKQRGLKMATRIQMLEQQLEGANIKPAEQENIVDTDDNIREGQDQPEQPIKSEEKLEDVLEMLEKVQEKLRIQNPLERIGELTDALREKTNDKKIKRMSRREKETFSDKCRLFIDVVSSSIARIKENQSDSFTDLPEFPVLSEKFVDTFKRVMKYDPPIICENLLVKPKEELQTESEQVSEGNPETSLGDCLICFEDLTPEEEVIRCWNCKKYFHKEGLLKWFKYKRTCPQCSVVILDEDEYPALS